MRNIPTIRRSRLLAAASEALDDRSARGAHDGTIFVGPAVSFTQFFQVLCAVNGTAEGAGGG